MAEIDVMEMLRDSGALKEGHFLLSSGLHSPAYVQCALLLEDPARARKVGAALAAKLVEAVGEDGLDSVVAPALGGLLIGHETAAALGTRFRFTERKDGAMELRRGFSLGEGERVVIIEDVVTTGKSTRETVEVIEGLGAKVVAVGSILDRSAEGGPFGEVPFTSLVRLDLPTWEAGECPLCAEGGRAEKPGSRK
jgi:orotate phosphoribosyltransferase